MASRFDGIILPPIPQIKDRETLAYLTDLHRVINNLILTLKQSHDDYIQKVFYKKNIKLIDDDTWDMAKSGVYIIMEDSSYCIASCYMNDAVTIIHEKTAGDWATADTDGKYCLIDQTTYIQLKNRTGSAKDFAVMIVSTT